MAADKKLPYFNFFPSDWTGDAKIRSMTYEERGIWMEVRCLLHQMDNRGILILGGEILTSESLARLLGLLEQNVSKLLSKWLSLGLLTRDPENGAYFSEEVLETERIRKIRSDVGKLGGDSRLLKQNSSKTIANAQANCGNGTGNGNDSSEGGGAGGRDSTWPTLIEVLAHCQMGSGVRPDCATAFWNTMEGCGWIDTRQRPVVDWRPILANFSVSYEENRHKTKLYGNGHQKNGQPNPRNAGIVGDAEERKRRLVETVARRQEANKQSGHRMATAEPANDSHPPEGAGGG